MVMGAWVDGKMGRRFDGICCAKESKSVFLVDDTLTATRKVDLLALA